MVSEAEHNGHGACLQFVIESLHKANIYYIFNYLFVFARLAHFTDSIKIGF